jgi:hypothetical protein
VSKTAKSEQFQYLDCGNKHVSGYFNLIMEDRKLEIQNKIKDGLKKSIDTDLKFAIPHDLSRNVISMNSIRDDLRFAKYCSIELRNIKEKSERDIDKSNTILIEACLWQSIIMHYGRCFTDASIASMPKLEPSDCFKNDNKEYFKTHTELMRLRHDFIAHRGDTHNEQAVVILNVPNNMDLLKSHISVHAVKAYGPSIEEIENNILLFDFLIEFVGNKMEKRVDKMLDSILKLNPKLLLTWRI